MLPEPSTTSPMSTAAEAVAGATSASAANHAMSRIFLDIYFSTTRPTSLNSSSTRPPAWTVTHDWDAGSGRSEKP